MNASQEQVQGVLKFSHRHRLAVIQKASENHLLPHQYNCGWRNRYRRQCGVNTAKYKGANLSRGINSIREESYRSFMSDEERRVITLQDGQATATTKKNAWSVA